MLHSLLVFLSLAALSTLGQPTSQKDYVNRGNLRYEQRSVAGQTSHLCTLHALGGSQDDSYNLEHAVQQCGTNGVINLPDPVYNLGRVLNLTLSNCYINFYGFLKYSDNINYWVNNSWHIPALQNQALGLSFLGNDFVLDGHNTGGMDGNGQTWYNYAKGQGNVAGRPMTLSLVDATDVVVKDFSVIQPQFWAHLTVQAKNVYYHNCYVNATNYEPALATNDTKSYLENTDGADTWRSSNITFENFVYQGGDDCIALKPNSTQITIRNLTCYGSTALAFGSIGQYPGVTDIIEDVWIEDVQMLPSSQSQSFRGLEFKSWVGVAYGNPPNGGGGGGGYCRNVTVKNFYVEHTNHPLYLQSDLTYTASQRGLHENTGTFEWTDIHLTNFTGEAAGDRLVEIGCSQAAPCTGWTFTDYNIKPNSTQYPEINFVCSNIVLDENSGLQQCRTSNSTVQLSESF